MTTRSKIVLNLLAASILVSLVVYTTYLLNQVTADMIQDRIVQANFFSRLIKENWEGIKSVSDEEKKALLGMLDPTLLSTDIRMLRLIILMLLWGFGLSVVINRSIAVFKLLRASRIHAAAP